MAAAAADDLAFVGEPSSLTSLKLERRPSALWPLLALWENLTFLRPLAMMRIEGWWNVGDEGIEAVARRG